MTEATIIADAGVRVMGKTIGMNKFTTTLKEIRAHGPCPGGWTRLLHHLGKTEADGEPLHLSVILESNGLDDALWALRTCRGIDKDARLFAVWCARQVQHLMTDERSIKALDVAERHALGKATDAELGVAKDAALEAAREVEREAPSGDVWAAGAVWAAWAAWDAVLDDAWNAAIIGPVAVALASRDAAKAVQEKRFRQMLEDDGFMEVSNA